jgi:hypothetical protein
MPLSAISFALIPRPLKSFSAAIWASFHLGRGALFPCIFLLLGVFAVLQGGILANSDHFASAENRSLLHLYDMETK